MKKILDFLRKIGLLQVSSGDYINGEFDDRKDIKANEDKNNVSINKAPVLFWVFSILIVVIILLSLMILGFSFWFFIILLFWILIIFYFKKLIVLGTFSFKSIILIFSIFLVFNFFIIIFSGDTENNSNTNISNIFESYNINSENNEISGKVDLSKNSKGKIVAKYDLKINTNLREDELCLFWNNNCNGAYSYIYVGNLETSDTKYKNPGNIGELFYKSINDSMSPTNKFTSKFTKVYDTIDEFEKVNIFKIYDGSKFMFRKSITTEKLADGSTMTNDTWILNQEKTLESGRLARTYKLKVNKIN